MKDWEPEDALSESTHLERELAEALAVDPSPEFLARVRSAVADAPLRAWWYRPVAWGGMAAAAVAAVVALALVRVPPLEFPQAPAPPTSAALHLPPPLKLPQSPPSGPGVELHRAALFSVAMKPAVRAESEVVIARDESAALRRLMHGWRQVVVEDPTVEGSSEDVQALLQLPDRIVVSPISAITPISIEPLGFEEGREQ